MNKPIQILTLAVTIAIGCSSHVWAVGNMVEPQQQSQRIAELDLGQRQNVCADLTFRNNDGIIHRGRLLLNRSGNGVMQVRFVNPRSNRAEVIDQVMTVRDSPDGPLIVGSYPVYAGTRSRHPTYHPDNFLLNVQPNGEYQFFMFDGQGTKSPVDVRDCR